MFFKKKTLNINPIDKICLLLYKGAAWDPDGRMILIAFSESSTLGSIHFASRPPSLGMLDSISSSLVVVSYFFLISQWQFSTFGVKLQI